MSANNTIQKELAGVVASDYNYIAPEYDVIIKGDKIVLICQARQVRAITIPTGH